MTRFDVRNQMPAPVPAAGSKLHSIEGISWNTDIIPKSEYGPVAPNKLL